MFGFAVALSLLALLLLLPMITSARLWRVSRELEELRHRLDLIEAQLRGTAAPPPPPPPSAPPPPALEAEPAARPPRAPVLESVPTATAVSAANALPSSDAATNTDDELDLEGRIGGRGLLYTGILVLLIGVSFFLKYAFDSNWIDERGRVVISALGGAAIAAAGVALSRRELRAFGQALIGAGLAILYLAIYAAFALYLLIGSTTAFLLLLTVTIVAAVLADREQSQRLALIAVGGGFLTPFLVSGGEDAQLTLFTYDALLIGGTLVLARRHGWHALNAVSYVLTVSSVLAWMSDYYSERTWLRTLLFLSLYCVMFVQILRLTRREATIAARAVTALLATAPVLYHIAAVIITAAHPPAIHVYLIAFTAVGLLFTAEPHRSGARLLLLAAGYLPLFGSLTLPQGLSWTMANVVTICGVAALHLLAILDRSLRQHLLLDSRERAALHIIVIGVFGLLYEALEYTFPGMRGAIAALLAIGAAGLWRALSVRDPAGALNAIALAFTLAAIAIAVQFDGATVVIGWAAEGAGAVWLGLRARHRWLQGGGLLLWTLAVARLFADYFVTPAAFTAILNQRAFATAFVVGLAYVLAALFRARREEVREADLASALLHVAASVITMLWITAEIQSYWEIRYETPQAYLYEQLVLSLTWGIYGASLIVIGMWRRYAPDRYIGITVLAVTILKVFFYDLWELGGIYRVIAFITFGALLVAVSYLYQQRRKSPPADG